MTSQSHRRLVQPLPLLATLLVLVSLVGRSTCSVTESSSSSSSTSAAPGDDESGNDVGIDSIHHHQHHCGLYLAISSTSTVEETNWGIYAGQDYAQGVALGYSDVAINMPYLRVNLAPTDPNAEALGTVVGFFERFFWVPETASAQFEYTGGKVVTAVPGPGVLAGYRSKLTNADWNTTAPYFRPAGDDTGVNHPNRGAVSPFYNLQVVSTAEIQAGFEVFLEFGDSWKDEEEEEEDEELTKEDYEHLDETITQMIEFFAKHKAHLNEDSVAEIYGFLKHDILKAAMGTDKAGKAAAILPVNPDDLDSVLKAGGALKFSKPRVYRSPEWLSQHGLCIDNIRLGESTVQHAGRGAFATRSIAAGQLVAPAPLVHFADKTVLDMHELFQSADGNYQRASDKVIGQQLMLNYCFAHDSSSLLFFPTGALVPLINHSDEPNAKVVWSSHSNHQKMWLTMTPQELMEEETLNIGLLIEIVATRDIAEDEEVFIDYGPAWKAAYQAHVADWQAKLAEGAIRAEWPLRAADLNEEHRDAVFRTVDEQQAKPYPENVELRAFLIIQDSQQDGSLDQPKPWGETDDETAYRHENLFAVEIIARDDATNTYTVKWVSDVNENSYVELVPHQAFVFVDKLGTSDQFTTAPFRHPIGLPDEIFPAAWRDVPKASSAEQQ